MTLSDPIADMLTRIRNAVAVRKTTVDIPYSKLKATIAGQLKDHNYIDEVEMVDDDSQFKMLRITINRPETNARITELTRMSTPGRRMYTKVGDIPVVKNGRGMVIISTSKGIMSGDQAVKERLGGELICKVY